jgi:hypothetical protein
LEPRPDGLDHHDRERRKVPRAGAIADATAARGNAKKLADAGTQMTAAAQSVAAQQYGAAIGEYEAAWQDAEAA